MDDRPELTLLDVVTEIADVVEPTVVRQLRRYFSRVTVTVDAGPWDDGVVAGFDGAFGLVVLDGVLARECTLDARRCTELFVAGDVATPWVAPATTLPVDVAWRVVQPTRVAVLDRTFLAAATRWPGMTVCLAARQAETCARLALHKTICQMPRVEDRISLLLWHLSERVGRVAGDGMIVPLPFTHAELGHLVGAKRSTITLALAELARSGAVVRREDGTFLLTGRPAGHLERPPTRPGRRPRRSWGAGGRDAAPGRGPIRSGGG
jgi:hypothetical protein